jgi:serine/threonine protein kinase
VTTVPPTTDAARDLLFGLLALQTGLINQGQLVAAFHAWTQARDRPMAEILAEQGALATNCLTAVEALVVEHLRRHGNDPERSLAALGVGRSTRECLAQLGNPELDASLACVGSGSTEHESDPDRTATYSVGSATSDGQRFRVLRPHAQGGLGAVFVALDTELHREVALKQILEHHADDPASRQRFLLEAEVTGGLEHPGIVPVYGLGTYGDGRPYYAMRFIRGDSLKEAIERFHARPASRPVGWVEQGEAHQRASASPPVGLEDSTHPTNDPGRRSLELRKLLRRFMDVCNAIDYAHSRGVLHRDIKPGNVIVGRYGETLVVDWGLAKATGQSDPASGERTLRPSSASGSAETLPGSALGTPAYMSPEQAEGNLEALGPRSDVYSLGATLYCLLTGGPPFAGDPMEVIPRVQRGEFRSPRQIDSTIDRALEAICLKAMALRPEDRYGTCRALAEDIERWLADEPVSAWKEPLGRRARRWGRRNRTAVAAVLVALVSGVVALGAVAGVQARANAALGAKNLQLTAANTATLRALDETTKAQAQTQTALAQSEASRKQAKAVNDFLTEDLLTQAEPANTAAEDHVSLLEVLDRAAGKVGDRFAGQPEVEDALRQTIAQTYHGLASWAKAEVQWRAVLEGARRRLGVAGREALVATGELAHILRHRGRVDAEVLEMAKSAAEGLARILGPDHPDTLISRTNLASACLAAGRTAEATTLHEATLRLFESKLGPDHPHTLTSRNGLASAYDAAGRTAEAITLHEATLKLSESKLGPDHPDTLISRTNLANAYYAAGRTAEAIRLHEATLKQKEKKLGPDHPETLATRNNLAMAYQAAGRTAEAITLLEATLKQKDSKLGPDHPDTLTSRNNLAVAYRTVGRTAEAITLFEATLKQRDSKLGPDHPNTLTSRNNLANVYMDAGRTADAIAMFEANLKLRESKLGPDHPSTLTSRTNLAVAYYYAGRAADAITLHEATLKLSEVKLGSDHPDSLLRRTNLAKAYQTAGQLDRAVALFEQALQGFRAKVGPDHPNTLTVERLLADAYIAGGQYTKAEPLLRECLSMRQKVQPDDWSTFNTRSQLGGSLLGQTKFVEAEPLILSGYEGLKAREAKIPAPSKVRLTEAAERVIRLYEAWDKPDQATAWKAKLGISDLPPNAFAQP